MKHQRLYKPLFFLLFAFSDFVLFSQSPVLLFPFSGNYKNEAGNSYFGENHGASQTVDRFMQANSACYFDGASYINILSDRQYDADLTSWSITAWIKTSKFDSNRRCIIGKRSQSGYSFNLYQLNDRIRISYTTCTNPGLEYVAEYQGVTSEWMFVVACYDFGNNALSLYINGKLAQSVLNGANRPCMSDSSIKIGYSPNVSSQDANLAYFVGAIDDVQIYNDVLSSQSIAKLYKGLYIKGQVTANGEKVENARILAYNIKSTGYQAVSAVSDKLGNFQINTNIGGYYRLVCIPPVASSYLPTWYYGQADCEYSEIIHQIGSLDSLQFELLQTEPKKTGNLSIMGRASLESVYNNVPFCETCRQLNGSLSSNCYVIVYLFDSNNNCIGWQQLDLAGQFQFNHLAPGNYSLQFAEPNFKTTKQGIALAGNTAVYSLLKQSTKIITVEHSVDLELITVVDNQIQCRDTDYRVSVLSIDGKCILANQTFPVSIAELETGIYLLSLINGNGEYFCLKIFKM